MANDDYKIIINGEAKTITSQEDITTIKRIFNKDLNDELTLKSVGDICNNEINFYIASYQRGYRWGEDEVNALLDDIYEVYIQKDKAQNYCLQPLVIKKCNNVTFNQQLSVLFDSSKDGIDNVSNKDDNILNQEAYELLDGQQRLTTLWIILNTINQKPPSSFSPKYSIYYELMRQIDNDFIKKAKEIIEKWIETKKMGKNNPEEIDLGNYRKTILENIYFIWYEVKSNESSQLTDGSQGQSEKLFRKINKGKIELTNAELFKAMLLNSENAHNKKEQDELIQISFEWDKIEQSLRNDDFWFFISNDSSEERTRIDYILEVYARTLDKDNKYALEKDRYSFLVVQDKLINDKKMKGLNEFDKINEIWKEIVLVHDKLYSWYMDNELYHNIGFLVACEGKRRSIASDIIVNLYKDVKDKKGIKETREVVKGKIYDYLIIKNRNKKDKKQGKEKYELEKLSYDTDRKYIADFLLFSNIYPLIKLDDNDNQKLDENDNQPKGRFPFKLYYNETWDIEHINPQTPKRGNIIDDIIQYGNNKQDENVNLVWQYLEKEHPDEIDGKQEKNAESLRKIWKDKFFQDGGDDIGNLVLLNSKINREYHNALFNQKRATIIKNDKEGVFIPLATKNVFLKYYTKNPDQFIVWDDKDIEEYMKYLEGIFDKVSKWTEFSQKNNTELK